MEFFENQVGEVRYLTTLPDPSAAGSVAPPVTPGTSSSPAASASATIANSGADASGSSNNNSNNSNNNNNNNNNSNSNNINHGSSATQRAQSRQNTSKPDKRAKKQASTTRHDTITSSATPSVTASTPGAPTPASVAGAKRKNPGGDLDDDDDELPNAPKSGPQQRSKRNRYISIACNECKRRKIKCNGETPCGRCGHLNLQCLYAPNCCASSVKDSEEFKQMANRVNHLQEQVETLFNSLHALRAETLRAGSLHQPDRSLNGPSAASTPTSTTMTMLPQPRQPSFRGPTSNRFSLDVAKNTLHKMGYSYPSDHADANGNAQETPSTSPKLGPQIAPSVENPTVDALWELDKDEMIRICRIYEEEVGIMYPVLSIESIISHAKTLATWMEAAKRGGLAGGQNGGINDPNTLLLKIVLCGGLLVEGHGSSAQAQRIFAGIKSIANRMLMSDPPNVRTLPFLALVAGYHFLSADEVLCWRVMGQVVRLCLELGLHRREAVQQIKDEEERRLAISTFWSVYVLDRRWAFSAGLPYVVPDEEIDSSLPSPEQFPFLVMMITYSKLSGRVWRFVRHFDSEASMDAPVDDIEHLDQLIKTWYNELPKEVQLVLSDWEALPQYLSPPVNSQKEYDIQRLQIWTWLRYNQIRMWLHTPILHTHSSIMDNLRHAEVAVKLAKNTIRYLAHLNNTTNVYRKMQIFYHQFLSSAITILFVASCHAPVNFSSSCRDEFYMALELLKDMSTKSWVSKRLWGTVKSLRDVAPRLGLAEDPHSSAALTMAGLATGHSQTAPSHVVISPFGHSLLVPPSPGFDGMQTPVQMSSEMSRIFEGVSVKHNQLHDGLGHGDPSVVGAGVAPGAPTMPFGPPRGSVYPPFRDAF
ncbi:putative fungal specific transcription factor domain-containing protein [Rosellinia necatrix]|uniref:Putative fungal specific transcription factor domain-containing protein n=1 Tax=Rosellinia necatrix TaxID=77044 RepID=A0A1W2TFA1_ROSNE|nr:putative fungal specific transcription factor domain-containing protein [Rosellinia necatrix]